MCRHNGRSQCGWISLTEPGHQVEVAVVDSAAAVESAVAEHDLKLIVCPRLKTLTGNVLAEMPVSDGSRQGLLRTRFSRGPVVS